ncbi:MAG: hypothetical protein ACXVGH_01960 [Mycobacteriales bacterium]
MHLATVAGRVLLCHGLGQDDMNRLSADDYGYSLEANDAVQALAAAAPPRLVVKGHTHHRTVYATGPLNVLDAGTLVEHGPTTVAVLDLEREEVRWFGWAGGWCEEHAEPLPQVDPYRPLPRDHTDLRR